MQQARAGDVIIVGRQQPDHRDQQSGIDIGDLLMGAGRPVLLVPADSPESVGKRVLIAWTDTTEARRAIIDGIPFLKQADEVHVISVGRTGTLDDLRDVADWLSRHGVKADVRAVTTASGSDADEVLSALQMGTFDLAITGAFGHSRVRQWIFGGMTRTLVEQSPVCCLMSH